MAASVGQRPCGLVGRATHRLDGETHTFAREKVPVGGVFVKAAK